MTNYKSAITSTNIISRTSAEHKAAAFREALNRMPDKQAMEISRAAERICEKVSRQNAARITVFSETAALEVLAALGAWLAEREAKVERL